MQTNSTPTDIDIQRPVPAWPSIPPVAPDGFTPAGEKIIKATLVKVDVASADLGRTAKDIFDLVDGGSLLEPALVWVFDLSPRAGRGYNRRELRFWRGELGAREQGRAEELRGLEIDAVIERILPEGRTRLTAGELDLLWQLRPRTRLDMNRQLARRRRRLYARKDYPREVLTAFLKRRWLGVAYQRPHWRASSAVPSPIRISPRYGPLPQPKPAGGGRRFPQKFPDVTQN